MPTNPYEPPKEDGRDFEPWRSIAIGLAIMAVILAGGFWVTWWVSVRPPPLD